MEESRRKIGSEAETETVIDAKRTDNGPAKPEPPKKNNKKDNGSDEGGKKRSIVPIVVLILVIGAAIGILLAVMQTDNFELKNPFEPEKAEAEVLVVDDGTIYDGITCMGVDLRGAAKGDPAKQAEIDAAAKNIIDGIKYDVKVNDYSITLDGAQLGAAIDTSAFLDEAYAYGREGSIEERKV